MKKLLITGSTGFIFSNFMRQVEDEGWNYKSCSVDKVISSYNLYNVKEYNNFYMGDVADPQFMNNVFSIERPDIVIHGCAESFVDDSIKNALPFAHSNVLGTQVMCDMSLKYGIERFVYVSTDEVYGQLKSNEAGWTEESVINPRNPYSASKAAGELIVKAANQTHGLNYNITRSSNNYGPRQPHRNLVPKIISCILNNKPIPIHGSGKQTREWLFVDDHCSAIMNIVDNAPLNETYNVGSDFECTNIEMVNTICEILGKGKDLITFIKDRPGHDQRYYLNCSKLKKIGWKCKYSFKDGIEKCVQWYLDNPWYFDSMAE
jgi:dTDP-glucose 4,6-dehydratase